MKRLRFHADINIGIVLLQAVNTKTYDRGVITKVVASFFI